MDSIKLIEKITKRFITTFTQFHELIIAEKQRIDPHRKLSHSLTHQNGNQNNGHPQPANTKKYTLPLTTHQHSLSLPSKNQRKAPNKTKNESELIKPPNAIKILSRQLQNHYKHLSQDQLMVVASQQWKKLPQNEKERLLNAQITAKQEHREQLRRLAECRQDKRAKLTNKIKNKLTQQKTMNNNGGLSYNYHYTEHQESLSDQGDNSSQRNTIVSRILKSERNVKAEQDIQPISDYEKNDSDSLGAQL